MTTRMGHPTPLPPSSLVPLTLSDALATHQQSRSSDLEPLREKTCRQCGETKTLDDFYRCTRNKDGRAYQCIACRKAYLARTVDLRRESNRRWRERNPKVFRESVKKTKLSVWRKALRQYGLTEEMLAELIEQQGGVCAICGGVQVIENRRLAIDHCHKTGAVRGLLCNRCNIGIGVLGDTADAVRKALAYLERAEVPATPENACEGVGQ